MIEIIAVGKLSTPGYKTALDHYTKQMSKFNIIETKETTMIKEAIAIEKQIDAKAYIIVLTIEGKPLSSEQLAESLRKPLELGQKIQCIIGGSEGLSDSIKQRAHLNLSLSSMTFPHQLARVMLIEQLYRATKIIEKHPYHK